MRQTSPKARRALKTNSIWRWLKRRTCTARGSDTIGGAGNAAASSADTGPAGEREASPPAKATGSSSAPTPETSTVGSYDRVRYGRAVSGTRHDARPAVSCGLAAARLSLVAQAIASEPFESALAIRLKRAAHAPVTRAGARRLRRGSSPLVPRVLASRIDFGVRRTAFSVARLRLR